MTTNFRDYFNHYIKQVDELEPIDALQETHEEFLALVSEIPEEKGTYAYEEGKWSIKEVLAHVIDSERVFGYRAMSFARNDSTNLAGFDDLQYTKNSGANNRTIAELMNEFDILRQSSMVLFRSFDKTMWSRLGTANNIEIDVKSIAYLVSGHCRHHGKILQERYLVG